MPQCASDPAAMATSRGLRRALIGGVSLFAMLVAMSAPVDAGGPGGAQVVAGSASISSSGPNQTLIQQTSQKAIINWQNFSIPSGASVVFAQPDAGSIALNRVTSPSRSVIDGTLSANGQVWILNANGVLFGAGSKVNAGALFATTADIANGDFLTGRYAFNGADKNPQAAIINNGNLTAGDGGTIALAGPVVENNGLISANLGSVTLASGKAFTLDFQGDNLIRFSITEPLSQTPKAADGSPAPALVSNAGKIAAAGGKIVLTARAASAVADNVINSSGIVEASAVHRDGGTIVFDAGDGGAQISGTVAASSSTGTGGSIAVTGKIVTITDGAQLAATGASGGGSLAIGGNLHGGGTLAHAQNVQVGKALLTADAINSGNGGSIAVWSDGSTSFGGIASARGGENGGNGGIVETSGHVLHVAPDAHVDTSAPLGLTGDWLLDPATITISSGGSDGLGCSTASCTIAPSTITNALSPSSGAGTNVTLESSGSGAAISITSNLVYSSANTLNLISQGSIDVAAQIQNTGSGAVTLIAGWNSNVLPASMFASATDIAALFTSTRGAYGVSGGAITIDGSSQLATAGSKGGTTLIAGASLVLNASSASAQIGYNGTGATGAIQVLTAGDITLTAGSCTSCAAQIGHGGYNLTGSDAGAINVSAGGTITLAGGNGSGAGAQIGHGGVFFKGATSGDISVVSARNLTLTSGASIYGYAQIGHGGDSSLSNSVGNITVTGSSINLTGAGDYAQIGHGGWGNNSGTVTDSGAVSVIATGDLILQGGASQTYGYAQIGLGGQDRPGNFDGAVTVSVAGNLGMNAGTLRDAYAQIGNGSINNQTLTGALSASGNLALTVNGTTALASSTSHTDAWIGNANSSGLSSGGNLTLITGNLALGSDGLGDFSNFIASDLAGGTVLLGFTGAPASISENLSYSSSNLLSILSTGAITLAGSIQNRGSGSVNVMAGWDGITLDSASFSNPAVFGNRSSALTLGASGAAVTLQGGVLSLYASGSVNQSGTVSAATLNVLTAAGDIALTNPGNTIGTAALTTGPSNSASLSDSVGLVIGGANTGALSLNTTGGLMQSGAIVASALNATTTSGDIVLANASNVIGAASLTTLPSARASLSDSTSLVISGVSTGALTLSAGGTLSQSGAIAAATLDATTAVGSIMLTNAGNAVGTASLTTGASSSASLSDNTALDVSNVTTGTLSLVTGGTLTQSGAIAAATLYATANSGNIALTNPGNVVGTASLTTSLSNSASLSDSAALTIASANTAALTLITAGGLAQSGAITAAALDATATSGGITLTNSANAIGTASVITGATSSASLTDSVALLVSGASTGTLTLSAAALSQSGPITASILDAATSSGSMTLSNPANAIGAASLITTPVNSVTLADSTALVLNSVDTGTLTLTTNGALSQSGLISAGDLIVSAAGPVTLLDPANTIAALTLSAATNASLVSGGDLSVSGVQSGGDLVLLSKGNLSLLGTVHTAGSLFAVGGWDGQSLTPAALAKAGAYGNAGGSVLIGGNAALGAALVGATGDATVEGANITLSAVNGFAQLGSIGGGGGALTVQAGGNVVLSAGGAGDYAQIGHGGAGTSGNAQGSITIDAGGNLQLTAGSGPDSYAQIGHGGASANGGSTGYSESGAIAVSAASASLTAGAGSGAYAQVGHGGANFGNSLSGAGMISGPVALTVTGKVALSGGGGVDAYAQVGLGGSHLDANATATASGSIDGLVSVTAGAEPSGGIAVVAGSGRDAYAQIGNGGYAINAGGGARASEFTVAGNVQLTDLLIQGGNSGANSYGQVGNGDASLASLGDVSGDISIVLNGGSLTIIPGTASGSGGSIGNATGIGTVSGSISGYSPDQPINSNAIVLLSQNNTEPTQVSLLPYFSNGVLDIFGEQPQLQFNSAVSLFAAQPQNYPLAELSGQTGVAPKTSSELAADALGNSLDGSRKAPQTVVLLPGGVLSFVEPVAPYMQPRGVPPADADYSSWGNEALWQ